ncbi:hypothetical protein BGZ46_007150 [Entomortierella lignicola]|nr:hypothetical protein BGZ46_007150 [Entomortierella lignicola]
MKFTLSTIALVLSLGLLVSQASASAIPAEVQANSPELEKRICQYICEVTCRNDTTGETITLSGGICKPCPPCPAGYTDFALSTVALILSLGLLVSKVEASAIPTEVEASNAHLVERICQSICTVTCRNDTTGAIITVDGGLCKGCPSCPAGYTSV